MTRLTFNWIAVAAIVLGMAALPERVLAQRPLGIDVSYYQGASIDWGSVKSSGVVFAWTRATEGADYYDSTTFAVNEVNAAAAGVYIGAYHFAQPNVNPGLTGADAEAAWFWSHAGPYLVGGGKYLMPVLDYETTPGGTMAAASAWINEWCQDIVTYGAAQGAIVKPVVYTDISIAGDWMNSSVTQWPLWMANPNSEDPQTGGPAASAPWSTWNFWQHGGGPVPGVPGSPDEDVFQGTLATLVSTYLVTSAGPPPYTWDPQGISGGNPYAGSLSGTWESANWSTSPNGQSAPVAWVEGQTASFAVHTGAGTPAFTVTMNNNHTVAGIMDGSSAQNSVNVTLTGAGSIELSSQQPCVAAINNQNGSLGFVTINNPITGPGQMVMEGSGQLYLNATNSYGGGTQLGEPGVGWTGIVNFNNSASFGSGPIIMTANGTHGSLFIEGTLPVTIPNAVTAATASLNILPGAGGTTFSGPWSLGASTPSIGTGASAGLVLTISGAINGSGGLLKWNNGTMVLTGVNTFTGGIVISNIGPFIIGGAGQLNGGHYAGAINTLAPFTFASSANQTLSGVISGSGPLTESGPGALTLAGANIYTGATAINGGILNVGSGGALASTGPIIFGGGTLQFSPGNQTDYSARFTSGEPFKIDLNGQTVTFTSALGGANGGSLMLKDSAGGGVLKLAAANTYTGATTITSGTLQSQGAENPSLVAGNSGFETPAQTAQGYTYGPSGATWVFEGAGIAANGSPWYTANAPQGTQAAFIQGAGSSISQTVVFPSAGLYRIGWSSIGRSGAGPKELQLQIDGNPISTFLPGTTAWSAYTSPGVSLAAGSHTLAFVATTTGSGDLSSCLDNVHILNSLNGVIPNGPGKGDVNLAGILDLNGVSEVINGLNGSGAVDTASGGAPTLTVGNNNANSVFSGVVENTSGTLALTKMGSGTLTLNGASTYSGNTTISAGTLALGSAGSINNVSKISVAAGATFDVSAIASYVIGGHTTLSASGTSSAATINGGVTVSLGTQPILLNYDGSDTPLVISQGTLALNGNPFTVNGPILAPGSYTLIQQAFGNITSYATCSVIGTALNATNTTAAISINGGNVILTISPVIPITSNAPVSITSATLRSDGTMQMTFSGVPGDTYLIEATTNLNWPVSWLNLSTNVADGNGLFDFIDLAATNYSGRYYRTALPLWERP